MESIVKIFTGRHIDLSKIVSITDAYFINRMGSGGYFVGFEIECQLLEKPIEFEKSFDYDEYTHKDGTKVKMVNGEYQEFHGYRSGYGEENILAVHRLQKQVDVIIEQWKEYNRSK